MRGVAHFAYKFGPIRTQTQLTHTHTQHTQGGASASFPSPPSLHLLGNIYVLAKCGEITQSVPDLGEKIRPRRMATMPMTAERMFDFWRSSKIYRKLLAISNRRVWKFENLYIKLKIPSLSLFHSTSLSVYLNAMMIIQNINFCFIYSTVKFRQVGVSSWPGAKDKSASKRDTTNERDYRESVVQWRAGE